MESVKVKAGYLNGTTIRCSMCLETKDAGRVYDFEIALMDPLTGSTVASRGVASICESCRKDFHYADLELEAPEMERQARQREEEEALDMESPRLVSEATVDALIDRYGPADRFGHQHWTFPTGRR